MFEDYVATKKDLEAVEEGLRFVEREELNFIFKDRSLIEKVAIVSYDSKFVYLWSGTDLDRIPHSLKIRDADQMAWSAGLRIRDIKKLLPPKVANFATPSGGLLTPFLGLQQGLERPLNPYVTRESYLATLVHEFAHIYYNQYPRERKEAELKLLYTALELFQGKDFDLEDVSLKPYFLPEAGEIFAFCTEYAAAALFWPTHKENLDKESIKMVRDLLDGKLKHFIEDYPHKYAAVVGKIILTKYPKDWPRRVLEFESQEVLNHTMAGIDIGVV